MGKIVVSTNASLDGLDGVVQDPDGAEGFRLGGWFAESGGEDLEEWRRIAFEEALAAEALLLGRRSEQWFASRWADRAGWCAPGPSAPASSPSPTSGPGTRSGGP